MGQTSPFLEIANDGLHLRVAAVVRLQLQSRSLSIRHQGVVAELSEKRQLAPWSGPYPTHNQAHPHPFLAEGGVGNLGDIGAGDALPLLVLAECA